MRCSLYKLAPDTLHEASRPRNQRNERDSLGASRLVSVTARLAGSKRAWEIRRMKSARTRSLALILVLVGPAACRGLASQDRWSAPALRSIAWWLTRNATSATSVCGRGKAWTRLSDRSEPPRGRSAPGCMTGWFRGTLATL